MNPPLSVGDKVSFSKFYVANYADGKKWETKVGKVVRFLYDTAKTPDPVGVAVTYDNDTWEYQIGFQGLVKVS